MNLAKKLGCIGFVVAFTGSFLFYASPFSWLSFESPFVCPWCPIADFISPNWQTWVQLGLIVGLGSGLVLAMIGFCAGYFVTLAGAKKTASINSN